MGRTTLDLDNTVLACNQCNSARSHFEHISQPFSVKTLEDGTVQYGDGTQLAPRRLRPTFRHIKPAGSAKPVRVTKHPEEVGSPRFAFHYDRDRW